MIDPTETARREMIATGAPAKDLSETTEPTWDTAALSRDFEVLGFMAPFVVVRRKCDGVKFVIADTCNCPRIERVR
jgi:hypothetical protein